MVDDTQLLSVIEIQIIMLQYVRIPKKEECVGHIQKRIRTALREYKRKMKGIRLTDGRSISGKGRLTDVMINRIQNCFGQCIRNNKGNL